MNINITDVHSDVNLHNSLQIIRSNDCTQDVPDVISHSSDVIVIGAGLSGLYAAMILMERGGLRVTVLDKAW